MNLQDIITACNEIAAKIEAKGWTRAECRLTSGKWDHATLTLHAAAHDTDRMIFPVHSNHVFGEDPHEVLAEMSAWADALPEMPTPEAKAAAKFARAVADARAAGIDPNSMMMSAAE
ncbi:hypothetical protein [Mangrovicoccus algicola]|uniref:Uncharacterized protein n=1 Tax=Mangrovicoccus algicola TaxID=2771008 RepID=A0A8J6YWZ4_9RHOB|nr:hypothetical protein [Mangrovicoccus algicola]MBE3637341.1 hypothetical protein [Mangrovicoccus algicola]